MTTPHEEKIAKAFRDLVEEDKKKSIANTYKARPLSEYLEIMGVDKGLFAFMCRIPESVVDRVLAGLSITNRDAMQIMRELRKAFSQDLDIKHVVGLKVV